MRRILALVALIAVTALPAAAQEILRRGQVYGTLDYTLFAPSALNALPYDDTVGLPLALPPGVEVAYLHQDDEDLIAFVRSEASLEALAAYYGELFGRRMMLNALTDVTVKERHATGLYRHGRVLLRWTVERAQRGLYRVTFNFERL